MVFCLACNTLKCYKIFVAPSFAVRTEPNNTFNKQKFHELMYNNS